MPGTMGFRELLIAHMVDGKVEQLRFHAVMLNDVFDLTYEEARGITDELGLKGEMWFCMWGHNRRDNTHKRGEGIIVKRG